MAFAISKISRMVDMSKQNIAKNILFLLIFLVPVLAHSSDLEFSLPDSLKELRFWDDRAKFIGKCSDGGPLTIPHIEVTPESGIAGELTVYRIDITLPKGGIPYSGGIALGFPGGFNLSAISHVDYTDNYNGQDLVIKKVFVLDRIISILFKKGNSPPAGTIITLKIYSITNSTQTGAYQIAAVIFNKSIVVVAGPTLSETFAINPGQATNLEVRPSEPLELRAGESQRFMAIAYDRYGNEIIGLPVQWSFALDHDSIGIISDGYFQATRIGIGQIKAIFESLIAQSGLITVLPGEIDHFSLTGYPHSIDAGVPFSSGVSVSAFDRYDNIKTDYYGAVYFASSDPQAELPFNNLNKYQFVSSDSGAHTFDGNLFILHTAGLQTITVTDGIRSQASEAIEVISEGYSLTYVPGSISPDTVIAGVEYSFAFDILLDSDMPIDPDSAGSHFQMLYGDGIISSPLSGFPILLGPGSNHIGTQKMLIPINLSGSILIPRLILATSKGVDTILFNNDFVHVVPSQPVSLIIIPSDPVEMRVGENRNFNAVVYDDQGNQISGLNVIWSFSPEYDSIGVISGGNLLAIFVGRGKLVASYNGLTAVSGLITVLPGEIDHFVLSGYPQIVTAGASWLTSVTVTVYDKFDNIKYDYDGSIFFKSSDPKAILHYNESNKYKFVSSDSGAHVFAGPNFQLGTIGFQTITATDGVHDSPSGSISVVAGALKSFTVSAEASVVAGAPYVITIAGAKDQTGNLADGIVTIILQSGGESPKAFEPILNDIHVSEGAGSAEQYLFATGTTVLRAESGGISHNVTFMVIPAELGELKLDIQPTQFIGNPILGPATITCFDKYGNLKTDFDASKTPVELTADTGAFSPSRIESKESFKSGTVDIGKMNIVYVGHAGKRLFSVESENVSTSAELNYNGLEFEPANGGVLDTVYFGESSDFGIKIFNRGNLVPIECVDLIGTFKSCLQSCYDSSCFRPLLPNESVSTYKTMGTDSLALNLEDTLQLFMRSKFLSGIDTISVTSTIYLPFIVLEGLVLRYMKGSFSIDTIISPSTIGMISMKFEANKDLTPGRYDIRLYPYYYVVEDEDYGGLSGAWQEKYSQGRIFTYEAYIINIPDIKQNHWFGEGYRQLNAGLYIYDRVEHYSIWKELIDFDSAYFVYKGDLAYAANSIRPRSVFPNRTTSFEFDINLNGKIDINLDSLSLKSDSVFQLFDEDTVLYSGIILNSTSLTPGINYIKSGDIHIPTEMVNDKFTPRLIIRGRELYSYRADTILFGNERVSISGLPQIKISSTELQTVNPPFVNYGQEFSIKAKAVNLSADTVSDVSILIFKDGTNDTVVISNDHKILPMGEIDVTVPLTADSVSMPAKIYRAAISAPNVEILPSDDNSIAVTIQSPAEIVLEYTLVGTYQGYVEYGQPFNLAVQMVNDGEAEASHGEVTISTGGANFGIPVPSTVSVEPDSAANWPLTAPTISGTFNLMVHLTTIPTDRNTGQPSKVKIDSLEIPIIVEPSQAELIVNGILSSAPLVIEGASSQLFELELKNNTENSLNIIGIKSIDIELNDAKGNLISPTLVLIPEETHFLENDQIQGSSEIIDDILRLNFPNFRLEPGMERKIAFRAKFKDNIDLPAFTLKIENRDIRAIFVSGPRLNQPVPVRGKFDNNFRIAGNFTVTPPTLGQSLMVRYNPFNPDIETAEIAYNLEANTDVSMKIFTLAGEKVYETDYPSGEIGGQKGTNLIIWDGRNDKGEVVLNGVYVLLIRDSSTGQSYKLKLAVMK